jgi:hypothetical protein
MDNVEVTKVEEHPGGKLLFRVRAHVDTGQIEFPVAIQDSGSSALNETTVLRSTLAFAEELAASVRLRLGLQPGPN